MIARRTLLQLAALAALAAAGILPARAQSVSTGIAAHERANLVFPQARCYPPSHHAPQIGIIGIQAGVVIRHQLATTTLEVALQNMTGRRQVAELFVPVPDGAIVRGFSFEGEGAEPRARLLPREEARRAYNAIVARIKDPALVQFAGFNLIRSSIFPVEANGTQRVRLTYEQLLDADGARVDYMLPRSESLGYAVPWKISVKIDSAQAIATVYSPSHEIATHRTSSRRVAVRLMDAATLVPGSFRLSILRGSEGVSASLFAYPEPGGEGGYFLMLAGLPPHEAGKTDTPSIPRELTLVLDRSGSMNGEKIEQVREAGLQILAGLEEGEFFNILSYNDRIDAFAPGPLPVNEKNILEARAYLKSLKARGGTNLHDALAEALRQESAPGRLPLMLFLTDGLPTVGQTSEISIRGLVKKANPHERRVFTFGAGADVNTPLLEAISNASRATSTFVLPGEDVEVKVAQVFRRLSGPILAAPHLEAVTTDLKPAPARVRETYPTALRDLFDGDQLVVLGRYRGEDPLHFMLRGNYRGNERIFRFSFDLARATTRNAFVPRLWASRKIAFLSDTIRQAGADAASAPLNPRHKELVDEIVRLSIEYGILTEYTAFLAEAGTDFGRPDEIIAAARRNFEHRAMATRTGISSVNQSLNLNYQRAQTCLNPSNRFWSSSMRDVSIATVQQVCDRAFFRRGERWVDSRLLRTQAPPEPARTIAFGSEEYQALVRRLASQGRQASIALHGEILLEVEGKPILVKAPVTGEK